MRRPELPLDGGCRCGRTRLRVSAPPIMTAACHCVGCRRMSGSAYSLTAMIPLDGVEVTQGATTISGPRGPQQDHHFCPHCMTWMFTQVIGADFVNLRPTMLDDHSWFEPYLETWVTERLPWATTTARHAFDGFPPVDAYGALFAGFAEFVED